MVLSGHLPVCTATKKKMKVGDLVYYLSPIGLPDENPLAIVVQIDYEKDIAHIKWTDNGQIDILPMKWLGIIQPSKLET